MPESLSRILVGSPGVSSVREEHRKLFGERNAENKTGTPSTRHGLATQAISTFLTENEDCSRRPSKNRVKEKVSDPGLKVAQGKGI
ncbi:hypothetical protein VTI74DRAFT_3895 [Chaetomium olivicolor]